MHRLFRLGLPVFLAVAGCTWPPKPSVPSAPNPGQTVQQQTNPLPLPQNSGTLAAPTVSLPRRGGLLGR